MRARKTKKEIQPFSVRLPYKTWKLLSLMSLETGKYMNDIVIELIEKNRKKFEKSIDNN